jgi:hypothetical protein
MLSSWVAAQVRWWNWTRTKLVCSDGREQETADVPGHYQGQGWPSKLDSSNFDSFETRLHWHCLSPHSTIHQLQLLCLIFQPYTQDNFHILEERTSRTCARNVCTQCSTCFNISPDLILIFFYEMNSQLVYTKIVPGHGNAHSPVHRIQFLHLL